MAPQAKRPRVPAASASVAPPKRQKKSKVDDGAANPPSKAPADAKPAEAPPSPKRRRRSVVASADAKPAEASPRGARAATPCAPTTAARGRTRPAGAAPAAAAVPPPLLTFDVGEHGVVKASQCDAAGLVGSSVSIPLTKWPGFAGSRGYEPCEIVGWAAGLTIAGRSGFYVLRASDGHHYAFSRRLVKGRADIEARSLRAR